MIPSTRPPPDPVSPPRNLPSEAGSWGPAGLLEAAGLAAVLGALLALEPAPRPLRAPLPDLAPTLAALDAIEARALPAPTDCDRELQRARRSQRGAIVFVRGPACRFVRDLPRK